MTSPTGRKSLFERPADYDRLRSDGGPWLFDAIVREVDLRGRRVLDVGCGTGTFLAYLAGIARAWGVDPSPEMRASARAKVASVKEGSAESLPFKDGWFERATMNSVVHLVDVGAAFPEVRRVLADDGRFGIRTLHPTWFDEYWLFDYFPSMRGVDLARFQAPEALERALVGAGFGSVRQVPLFSPASVTREHALERTRGRHISSFDLITDEEFDEGLERMERELPEHLEYERRFHLVVADC
jgi:SAM-dependent methyltransferase